MGKRNRMIPVMIAALALGLVTGTVSADDNCTDDGTVCLTRMKGAAWSPNKKSSKKDRKRRGRGKAGSLKVSIDNGRGSVFLNGRYVGTAPVDYLEVPSGRNDVQVRDGMIVLAEGLLSMPKGKTLELRVQHP